MSGRMFRSRRRRLCSSPYCIDRRIDRGDLVVRVARHRYEHAFCHDLPVTVDAMIQALTVTMVHTGRMLETTFQPAIEALTESLTAWTSALTGAINGSALSAAIDRTWDIPVAVTPTGRLGEVRVIADADAPLAGRLVIEQAARSLSVAGYHLHGAGEPGALLASCFPADQEPGR